MIHKLSRITEAFGFASVLLVLSSCESAEGGGSLVDNGEYAQQVGDLAVSVDEMGGSNGIIAFIDPQHYRINRPEFKRNTSFLSILDPLKLAQASEYCSLMDTFSACENNERTRTFDSCLIGAATYEGFVYFAWEGDNADNCQMGDVGDSVIRQPYFAATGLRSGAVLSVEVTGAEGQRLVWESGAGINKVFSFTNDGIRRKFIKSSKAIFDFSTKITDPVTVTGALRSNRVLDGGVIEITNNKREVTCEVVPDEVTWDGTCNCPVGGSWSGTCSNERGFSLTITGCGTGRFAFGDNVETVNLDRCYEI